MGEDSEEIRRLKIKCNMQIDELERLQREQEGRDGNGKEGGGMSGFCKGMEAILAKLRDEGLFIEYRHASKYSTRYLKVAKETLETLITELAGMEPGDFLPHAKALNVIKSEENGKCVYNSDSLRVYYLNKALAELFGGRAEPE